MLIFTHTKVSYYLLYSFGTTIFLVVKTKIFVWDKNKNVIFAPSNCH